MKWLSVSNWKIRGKILLIVTTGIVTSTAVLGGFFIPETISNSRQEIRAFEKDEMRRIRGHLRDLVNSAYTVVEKNHRLAATMDAIKKTYGKYLKSQVDIPFSVMVREHGKLDLSLAATEDIKQSFIRGAQQNAVQAIRAMRFGERGYFWINDTHPRMVMHPIVPKLEGKDLTNFSKDGKVVLAEGTNRPFFQEMVRVCKNSPTGDGFVGYRWPDPKDKSRWLLKLSYVRLFKPWNWIVGAGFYIEGLIRDAQEKAKVMVGSMRYGEKGHFWINDTRPRMIMHPIIPELEGKDLSNFSKDGKVVVAEGTKTPFFQEMVRVCTSSPEAGGFVTYRWPDPKNKSRWIPKLSYVRMYKPWNWIIGTGVDLTDVQGAIVQKEKNLSRLVRKEIIVMLGIMIGVVALAVLVSLFMSQRFMVKPIRQSVDMLKDIAEGEGDLTNRLQTDSRDEIGEMARWFNTFIEKIQGVVREIVSKAETLNASSTNLTSVSEHLSSSAEQMSAKSDTVAAAAEEMNANMTSVAAAMEESSTNVTIVATSAEEMTSTINEIAQSSERARGITSNAVAQAERATAGMEALGKAAQEIDKVTETITEISEQTNLLALNATIEAARAGESGKGFAVVANEIKELARQTADATDEIREKIDGIQSSTQATVDEIRQISTVIADIDQIVATIATAVEEQSATTREIAQNVGQASKVIGEVSENVVQSSRVSGEITQDIADLNQASTEISNSGAVLSSSAEELSALAQELRDLVVRFKV